MGIFFALVFLGITLGIALRRVDWRSALAGIRTYNSLRDFLFESLGGGVV